MNKDVSLDLMNEHSLLERIILALEYIKEHNYNNSYNKIIKLIKIVKEFIEDFHEKMEEEFIFPVFNNTKYESMTKKLTDEHIKSRLMTSEIIKKSQEKDNSVWENINQFIKLYRMHANLENLLLFRKFRKIYDYKKYIEISEILDKKEDEKFGKGALDKFYKEIIIIERE